MSYYCLKKCVLFESMFSKQVISVRLLGTANTPLLSKVRTTVCISFLTSAKYLPINPRRVVLSGSVVVVEGGGVDIYPLSANAEILSGRCILKCISTMSRDLRCEKHIRSKDAMMDARHFITSGNNSS